MRNIQRHRIDRSMNTGGKKERLLLHTGKCTLQVKTFSDDTLEDVRLYSMTEVEKQEERNPHRNAH